MTPEKQAAEWHRKEAKALWKRVADCRSKAISPASTRPYRNVMRAEADASALIARHHELAADALDEIEGLRAAARVVTP